MEDLADYRAFYAGTVCACGEYFEARGTEASKACNSAFQAHAATCAVHQAFAALPQIEIGDPVRKSLRGLISPRAGDGS